jgi:hypothetical protein
MGGRIDRAFVRMRKIINLGEVKPSIGLVVAQKKITRQQALTGSS